MLGASRETIKCPDENAVEFPLACVCHELIEGWPFYLCSTDPLVAIDLMDVPASVAAVLAQGVKLHVYALHVS
jgi:hypothetical protein